MMDRIVQEEILPKRSDIEEPWVPLFVEGNRRIL
jgi:hypothetical protein